MTLISVCLIVFLGSIYHNAVHIFKDKIKSLLLWEPRKLDSDLSVVTNTVSLFLLHGVPPHL